MSIKLMIFDFDGTLGDTRRNIVTTMQMAIKEMQLPSQNIDVYENSYDWRYGHD